MFNSILTDENVESYEHFLKIESPKNIEFKFLVNESLTQLQIWENFYFLH